MFQKRVGKAPVGSYAIAGEDWSVGVAGVPAVYVTICPLPLDPAEELIAFKIFTSSMRVGLVGAGLVPYR